MEEDEDDDDDDDEEEEGVHYISPSIRLNGRFLFFLLQSSWVFFLLFILSNESNIIYTHHYVFHQNHQIAIAFSLGGVLGLGIRTSYFAR